MGGKQFRIIPVVDLKGGVAVHAIRGERERYKPVVSPLAATPEFFPLVAAFGFQLGLTEVYVADLDAITGGLPEGNFAVMSAAIKKIHSLDDPASPFSFMVDAGVRDCTGAEAVFAAGANKVIVGTETLTDIAELAVLIGEYGSGRVVVSLDSCDDCIISPAAALRGLGPPEAILRLREYGAEQFVLLELKRVGTAAGLNRKLIQACLACLPLTPGKEDLASPSLLIGGGVSGRADLEWLKQAGVAGALIATALHDGRLTVEEIKAIVE
ncbi:MAG: HisA/HisF-related TIM barrel protein [Negativicutes bacterium]|nr:HisA/HisF-related TIM barrel protein [Negativicutes bacterium]